MPPSSLIASMGLPSKASDICQIPGIRGSGRPKTHLSSIIYIRDHARRAPLRNPNGPYKKPRTSNNTIKVNCPAKYLAKHLVDGTVKVEYHWEREIMSYRNQRC
ncbi:hypothetical protein BJV82DRAFT_668807 [Fennellomyces sp. T-0311]|nr:hypothetical protein BJV82DRAFT_668807 [Fennellomyces sp. T-0311]